MFVSLKSRAYLEFKPVPKEEAMKNMELYFERVFNEADAMAKLLTAYQQYIKELEKFIPLRTFISTKHIHTNVSKGTVEEHQLVNSIVAILSNKRIPDPEIMKEVYNQTNRILSRSGLYRIR